MGPFDDDGVRQNVFVRQNRFQDLKIIRQWLTVPLLQLRAIPLSLSILLNFDTLTPCLHVQPRVHKILGRYTLVQRNVTNFSLSRALHKTDIDREIDIDRHRSRDYNPQTLSCVLHTPHGRLRRRIIILFGGYEHLSQAVHQPKRVPPNSLCSLNACVFSSCN